jgi:hypothetical protein
MALQKRSEIFVIVQMLAVASTVSVALILPLAFGALLFAATQAIVLFTFMLLNHRQKLKKGSEE